MTEQKQAEKQGQAGLEALQKQIVDEYLFNRIKYFLVCAQAATENNFTTVLRMVDRIVKLPLDKIRASIMPVRQILIDIRKEVQYSDAQIEQAHNLLAQFHPTIVRNPDNIPVWLDSLMSAANIILGALEILEDGEVWQRLRSGQPFAAGEKEWLQVKMAEKLYEARMRRGLE